MAGTVGDEGDESSRMTTEFRFELVDEVAHELHEVEIGYLVVSADVVGFANLAGGEDGPQSLAMIADVEPVAHVHAIAIDGNGFAAQNALDDDGDELLRELIGAVVVGAVRDERGQSVGVMVAAHEHVTRGFAGGVRRVRRIGCRLGEEAGGTKGAEDLVGADVQESVRGSRFAVHGLPSIAAGLKQVKGAVDVGGDEVAWAGDTAVHMRLGSKVHDVGDVMLADNAEDLVLVPQIDFFEDITRMDVVDAIKVFKMPRVGEAIEIDELRDFRLVDDMPDEVRADEACTACDEEVHALLMPTRRTSAARSAR